MCIEIHLEENYDVQFEKTIYTHHIDIYYIHVYIYISSDADA